MLGHVESWKTSGQSRASYCAQHGLNIHVLGYWCAKAKRQSAAGGFAPVELAGGPGIEVCYPNGVRLMLPRGTSMMEVAAYVRLY